MKPEQVEQIVQLYQDGRSLAQIGEAIGVNTNTVKHWVRLNRSSYGLQRRRDIRNTVGAVSFISEDECKWNNERSVQWLTRQWGSHEVQNG